MRLCERAGVEPFRRLDPQEVAARSGSAVHRAGVFDASAAIVQPAALARGLRRVALSLGVRIYEHTKVRGFSRGRPVLLRSSEGTLRADRLVIATNAWSASLPELRRAIVVVSSDMVATAPIPDRLRAIGWEPNLSISDSQMMVDYYRPTRDGRIAFGKGGWTIALGGRIGPAFDRHPGRAAEVRADLHRTYPMLSDVAVTHDWSGPIDRTPDSLPLLGLSRRPRAHRLRRRLERQRGRAEPDRREDPREPGPRAKRRVEPASDGGPLLRDAFRPSPSASWAPTSCGRLSSERSARSGRMRKPSRLSRRSGEARSRGLRGQDLAVESPRSFRRKRRAVGSRQLDKRRIDSIGDRARTSRGPNLFRRSALKRKDAVTWPPGGSVGKGVCHEGESRLSFWGSALVLATLGQRAERTRQRSGGGEGATSTTTFTTRPSTPSTSSTAS